MPGGTRTFATIVGAPFDTYRFIRETTGAGIGREQAIVLSRLCSEALSPKLDELLGRCLAIAEFKKAVHQHGLEASRLKNNCQAAQRREFMLAKSALEQLQRELFVGRQRTRETMAQIRSDARLEMSLERGRQRDANLSQTLKFQDMSSRVDTEASNNYAALGKLRHDIFYSLTGFFFTTVAAMLGYLRYCS